MSKRTSEVDTKMTLKKMKNTIECGDQDAASLKFDVGFVILMISKMEREDVKPEDLRTLIESMERKEEVHSKVLRELSSFKNMMHIPHMNQALIDYCKDAKKLFE